jgi:transglutaminase-like putative cysteine protease
MNLKKTILFINLLLLSNSYAQKFELGKVSEAELTEKKQPLDTSAAAAILYKKSRTYFDFNQNKGDFDVITEVQTRIKIYKKEGYEWANNTIGYLTSVNTKENVSFSDAITYNLVGGKIEKTKVKSESIFDEKVNKYWNQKKITMPNVKEGSIIEYKYIIRSPYRIPDYYFQESIPVNYIEFSSVIPEYYAYEPRFKGSLAPLVTTEQKSRIINFSDLNSSQGSTWDFRETKTTYKFEKLPAMLDEGYVNNINNYRSGLSLELSYTKFPQSPIKNYSTDWNAVVKTIYNFDGFGEELKKTGYFEKEVDALISKLNSPEEKIVAIFQFVKNKVKWNELHDYTCDGGVKKAYKEGSGNSAEINLMLTAMLRYAKINANPVLLSTRAHGIAFYPSIEALNHVIAGVEMPEGVVLLDATSKFSLPNVLPEKDLNWYGRMVKDDKTAIEVDLRTKKLSLDALNLNVILNEKGDANGNARHQYGDYKALNFREENLNLTQDAYLEQLEKENNAIEVDNYIRENDLNLGSPIVENYTFKDNKSVEIINGKMYVSPLFFATMSQNPFKQEKREYPVDLSYPRQKRMNIMIEIPKGYKIESIPESTRMIAEEQMGEFKYLIQATDNKIQLSITSSINWAIVPTDYYEMLKDFYQKMITKQNEKIVLIKI